MNTGDCCIQLNGFGRVGSLSWEGETIFPSCASVSYHHGHPQLLMFWRLNPMLCIENALCFITSSELTYDLLRTLSLRKQNLRRSWWCRRTDRRYIPKFDSLLGYCKCWSIVHRFYRWNLWVKLQQGTQLSKAVIVIFPLKPWPVWYQKRPGWSIALMLHNI